MAFLRFSRDKRGYEHFYLVEATTNRRGKSRTRVLYWFRTPPNVKVGREPFDDGVRRALEQQNPGVTFDWRKIVDTPIPSADAERWRERRRVERAEKAARRKEAAARVTAEAATPSVEAVAAHEPTIADEPIAPGEDAIDLEEPLDEEAEAIETLESLAREVAEPPSMSGDSGPEGARVLQPSEHPGRRRRRRRRRGRRGGEPQKPDGGQ